MPSLRTTMTARVRAWSLGRVGVRCGPPGRLAVGLTYDDGPSPHTVEVLAVLRAYNATATFFQIGREVDRHYDWAAQVAAEGHEIGSHGWSHVRLTRENVQSELTRANKAISGATGSTPTLLRAPHGDCTRAVSARAQRLGLTSVLWDVDPKDWKLRHAGEVARRAVGAAHPGAVILLHDGGGGGATAAESTRRILDALSSRDYTFLTISQLLS